MGILLLYLLAVKGRNSPTSSTSNYDISNFDRFMQDGEIIALHEVFPNEWDAIYVLHTTIAKQYDTGKLEEFEKKNDQYLFLI